MIAAVLRVGAQQDAIVGIFPTIPAAHQIRDLKNLPAVLPRFIAVHCLDQLIIEYGRIIPYIAVPANRALRPAGDHAVQIYAQIRITIRCEDRQSRIYHLICDAKRRQVRDLDQRTGHPPVVRPARIQAPFIIRPALPITIVGVFGRYICAFAVHGIIPGLARLQ